MAQIRVESLTKEFRDGDRRVQALRDVSFDLDTAEFKVLVGPSGSGKSTLLRIIAGLIQPTSGRVVYREGEKFDRGDISFVFQDYALFPWRTVEGNLRAALSLAHEEPDEATIDAHLEMVGLGDFRESYPHQLSGGMKQRAALARALITDPEVILMDEPFAALDALTKEALYGEFREILASTDRTILYVTHDIEEAYLFADTILLLSSSGEMVDEIDIGEGPRQRDALETEAYFETKDRILDEIGASL